jgi:hypothetical protein
MLKITLHYIIVIAISTYTENLQYPLTSTPRTPTLQHTLTEGERKYLLDFMVKTKERLLTDVKGLTPAQLNFKPDSSRWSVAECVEHITIAENLNMSRVIEGLKTEADPSKRSQITMTDEDVLKRYSDRSNKRKTGEELEPKSRFGPHEGAMKEFLKKRDSNIGFVETTRDDLRNRITTYSFGTIDLYQCILALTAHSERHIIQLEEVMADPKFPK